MTNKRRMNQPVLVGLTGGLASGKSTVADWLSRAGFTVVDADEVVADLYRKGEAGTAVVRELFGAETLDADGAVDHARLAERVFSDPQALESLEERVHPLVRERFAESARSSQAPTVLEATLLVEAGNLGLERRRDDTGQFCGKGGRRHQRGCGQKRRE